LPFDLTSGGFIVHQKHFAALTALTFAAVAVFTAGNGARAQQPGETTAAPVGVFESHGDVWHCLHPGSVEYDAAKRSYTIAGSGANMWLAVMHSSSRGRKCRAMSR